MNQRKTGAMMSYLAILVKLVVGLLYVPILLRYLNNSEYGLYQLMGSLISYLAVMDFGLSATVIRYYSIAQVTGSKEENENVLGTANRIYLVISSVTFACCCIIYASIGFVFAKSLNAYEIMQAKRIFSILTANILVTLMTNIYISILNTFEKFVFLRIIDIMNSLMQILFIFIAMNISATAISVVIMNFCINLIASGLKIIYCSLKLKVRIKYHYLDRSLVKGMLSFSISVFVVSIVDQIYWRTGQIVLGAVSGTTAVAVYGVASQIYWNYMPISTTIQGVFLPSITKRIALAAKDEELSNDFIRIGRIQFLILGCVLSGFILLGKQFIAILAGQGFMAAYWICVIIMIPFTIDLIQNVGVIILQAKNQYAVRAKVYMVAAVFNILLSIILAKKLEGIGCAIASAVCMIFSNGIAMNIYYHRKLHINIIAFWKNIGKLAAITLAIMVLFRGLQLVIVFDNIYIQFLVQGIIYLMIYAIVMYRWAMNAYEKGLIHRLIMKVLQLNKHT